MSDKNQNDDRLRPGEDGIDYWRRISHGDEPEKPEEKPEEYWNTPDDYGFRPMNNPDYGPVPDQYQVNGMTKAALLCGIFSLVTVFFGYGFFFAGLGILFALLSRKSKMPKQAKLGLAMCIASLGIFVFSLVTVIGTLSAGHAWPYLMEQARATDFSDPASIRQFEGVIYDSFYRSLMFGNAAPPAADAAASQAESAISSADPAAPPAESVISAADPAASQEESAVSSADPQTPEMPGDYPFPETGDMEPIQV